MPIIGTQGPRTILSRQCWRISHSNRMRASIWLSALYIIPGENLQALMLPRTMFQCSMEMISWMIRLSFSLWEIFLRGVCNEDPKAKWRLIDPLNYASAEQSRGEKIILAVPSGITFTPIHQGQNHWVLAIINDKRKTVTTCDSMVMWQRAVGSVHEDIGSICRLGDTENSKTAELTGYS